MPEYLKYSDVVWDEPSAGLAKRPVKEEFLTPDDVVWDKPSVGLKKSSQGRDFVTYDDVEWDEEPSVETEDRSLISPIVDYGKGFVSGVKHRLPEMVGQAGQFLGIESGKRLAEWGREGEEQGEKGAFRQAGEMTPVSAAIPMALNVLGTGIMYIPHPIAKGIGGALKIGSYVLTPAMFGLSQAQQTKETAEQAGVDPGAAPYITGGIETAGETIGNMALLRLLGPLAPAVPLAKAGAKQILKTTIGRFGKQLLLKTLPTEITTEIGQQFGEASVEKAYNIRPDAQPIKEAMSVIAPTAIMTIVSGSAGGTYQNIQASTLLKSLTNPEIEAGKRHDAVNAVAGIISGQEDVKDKPISNLWLHYAHGQIDNNLPIDIDTSIMDIGETTTPEPTPESTLTNIKAAFDAGEITTDDVMNYARSPEAQEDGIVDELNALIIEAKAKEELAPAAEPVPLEEGTALTDEEIMAERAKVFEEQRKPAEISATEAFEKELTEEERVQAKAEIEPDLNKFFRRAKEIPITPKQKDLLRGLTKEQAQKIAVQWNEIWKAGTETAKQARITEAETFVRERPDLFNLVHGLLTVKPTPTKPTAEVAREPVGVEKKAVAGEKVEKAKVEEIPTIKEGMEDLYSWYITAKQRGGKLSQKEIETTATFKSGKRDINEIITYLENKGVEVATKPQPPKPPKAKPTLPRTEDFEAKVIPEVKPKVEKEKVEVTLEKKISQVPTESLSLDPTRFQFKRFLGKGGVSSTLKSISKYNPDLGGIISVWRDPSDNKTYIVNGHHRYELAKRTGQKDLTVNYLDAANAGEAKFTGALINIAEGQGTPEDAAVIFRKNNVIPEEIEKKYGISLKGKIAQEGMALSGLSPEIFEKVELGEFSRNWGVVIGEKLRNDFDAQNELAKLIKQEGRKKHINTGIIEQVINDIQGVEKRTETQETLFGDEIKTRPLLIERAELRDYAINKLLSDKRLFGIVSKEEKATRLRKAGNIITPEENKKLSEEAGKLATVLNQLASHKGPINDTINEYAKELANAVDKTQRDTAKQSFFESVQDVIRQEVPGIQKEAHKAGVRHGEGREADTGIPAEQVEGFKPKPKLLGGDELIPKVKPAKKTELAALDKIERQATSKFEQDSMFGPNQQGLFEKPTGVEATYKTYETKIKKDLSGKKLSLKQLKEYAEKEGLSYFGWVQTAYEKLTPKTVKDLKKEIADLEKRKSKIKRNVTTRAQATTREASLGKIQSIIDVKQEALRKIEAGEKKFSTKSDEAQDTIINDETEELRNDPYFKKWIEETKVLNKNDEPLIVYHGTKEAKTFAFFDSKFLGQYTDVETQEIAKLGFWFSEKSMVGRKSSPYKTEMKAFLLIKNPYYVELDELSRITNAKKYIAKLEEEGHDGLEVKDTEFGGTSWVPFDTDQIEIISKAEKKYAHITKPQKTITRKDLRKIFSRMKHIRTGQDKDGNLWFKATGRPIVTIYELDAISGYLNTSAGQIPVGSYLKDTIELKTGGKGYTADIGTAYHEFFHWLEKNSILSANDIIALNKVIAKDKSISESAVTEEHRADYVGDNISVWETQKHPRIRRILRKLKDFMRAIYDFAAQAGWVKERERTAESVLSDIESGRILSEKELAGVNEFAQDVAFSLKKTAKAVTDNPNFVKWFKNSQVVNENGEPLVVYHGTKAIIDQFKHDEKRFDDRLIFFSKSADFAADWALGRQANKPPRNYNWTKKDQENLDAHWREFHKISDELYKADKAKWNLEYDKLKRTQPRNKYQEESMADASVYPVFISAQNIFNPVKDYKIIESMIETIDGMQGVLKEGLHKEGNWLVYERKDVIAFLESKGYDGIYIKESAFAGAPHDTIAVWNPTQIKSIFNTGAFGIKEPDIRYSMAGTKAIGAPTGQLVKAQEMLSRMEDIRFELKGWSGVKIVIAEDGGARKYKIINSKGEYLDRFATREEAQAKIDSIAKMAREARGLSKKEVWRKTGWIKTPDNKWKWEIDDSGAKIDKDSFIEYEGDLAANQRRLSSILKHDKLYEAYPDLAHVEVSISIKKSNENTGSFREATRTNLDYYDPTIKVYATSFTKAKEILLHEIQHYIQSEEGFARGSSPQAMKARIERSSGIDADKVRHLAHYMEKLKKSDAMKKEEDAYFKFGMTEKALKKRNNSPVMRDWFKTWDSLETIAKKYDMPPNQLRRLALDKGRLISNDMIDSVSEYDQYQKLAGEIEARSVAARAKLTPEQRREQMPYESQGIPEDQWIITEGKGTSFSIEEKATPEIKIIGEDKTILNRISPEVSNFLKTMSAMDVYIVPRTKDIKYGYVGRGMQDRPQDIYIGPKALKDDAELNTTIFHEALHQIESGRWKTPEALAMKAEWDGFKNKTPRELKEIGFKDSLWFFRKSHVKAIKAGEFFAEMGEDYLENPETLEKQAKPIFDFFEKYAVEQKAFSVKGGKDYSAMFEKYRVKRKTPLVDELTMGEEKPSFLDTLEPVTSEDYLLNRKASKSIKLTAVTNIKRVTSEIVEGVDKFLGSTSTRIGRVSLKLKAKLRKLDFDINTKYAADVKSIHSLLKKAKKMNRNDFADWDYARKNSDIKKIDELINKYNMQAEYVAYRKVLDDTRKEGLDVGLVIGEIEEYAPRILKDDRGFLKEIGKPEYRPLYSDQLKKRAQDMKMSVESLPLDLKADIISNIMLGGWVGLGGIPATKHRVLQKIPVNLNKYYMHSDAALMQHLYSMRKGIEARKFFGEIPKRVKEIRKRLYHAQAQIRESNRNLGGAFSTSQEKEIAKLKQSVKDGRLNKKELLSVNRRIKTLSNIKTDTMPDEQIALIKKRRNKYIGLEKQYTAYIQKYALQRDYTENIGAYIVELIEKKEIDAKHERIVNDMLKARFHEVGTRGVIQMYKNLSYIDTMGSPISALTQIGDMAWAMYEGGLIRSLKYGFKAAIKKSRITKEDVGVERIAQEFADSGTLGDAVSKVFKIVGLEKIDSIGKEALLNTALEKYQKRAKKEPLKFKKELNPIFGIETDSVIEDLVNDEISENVKLLVYSRLLDFQPVALSEMPQRYLDAGNGRLFYMLKTFTLKVFDVFRNESYNKIRYGNKADKIQGIKNFVRLSLFFVLANAGADELKDWVLGRKTDFEDRVVDNILRLCGVSKFVTWKARTEGVGSALARQILPPFKFIDSAGKDILTAGDEKGLEVIGSIPVVGKLAYWHIGRGTSKREDLWNRRLRKQKAKLNKIKDGLEKTKNKTEYRRKHRLELRKLRQVNELQGELNDYRKRINRLKSMKEIPARKKRIQMLEVRRTELIKKFLKRN